MGCLVDGRVRNWTYLRALSVEILDVAWWVVEGEASLRPRAARGEGAVDIGILFNHSVSNSNGWGRGD